METRAMRRPRFVVAVKPKWAQKLVLSAVVLVLVSAAGCGGLLDRRVDTPAATQPSDPNGATGEALSDGNRGLDASTGGGLGGPEAAAAAARVDCPALGTWDPAAALFEAEVLALVNAERARGGSCGGRAIPPREALRRSDAVTCVARTYARKMRDRGFFSHTGDDGSSVADRLNAAKVGWSRLAENIARGQRTPKEVMQGWMTSAGHCANILGETTELGVGYDGDVWVQVFIEP